MIPTILCALATAALVYSEYRQQMVLRAAAKCVASGSFVALGLAALPGSHVPSHTHYVWCVVIGLIAGAIGDLCLLGKSSRAFLAGLAAFLVGHLAYVVGMTYLVPPAQWIGGAGVLAIVPAIAGVTVVALLWSRLGSMKGPVVAYLLAIVAMVIGALAVWRLHALGPAQHRALVVGAVLFFASDISVAKNRFVGDAFVNKAWGLPAYFAGQILIAWSLTSS